MPDAIADGVPGSGARVPGAIASGVVADVASVPGASVKYEVVSSRALAGCSCAAALDTEMNTIPKMAKTCFIAYIPQRAGSFPRP